MQESCSFEQPESAFEQSKMQKSMVNVTSKIPPPRGLEKCISRMFDTRPKAEEVMPHLTAQKQKSKLSQTGENFFSHWAQMTISILHLNIQTCILNFPKSSKNEITNLSQNDKNKFAKTSKNADLKIIVSRPKCELQKWSELTKNEISKKRLTA